MTMRMRDRFSRMWQLARKHPILSVLALLITGFILYKIIMPTPPDYAYVSEAVSRGEVTSKVTASGKLRALNTIKVGAEVSGQIQRVHVDFNTPVAAGQVLAEIDQTRFQARVRQAEAQVAMARASLAQAEANGIRARSDIELQDREFARRQALAKDGYLSKSGLDSASGQLNSARAAIRTTQAVVMSARAQIAQAEAELSSARLDLRRTVIVAPTSGVVINKLVDPGTTVAASFQTPNLFEIAADITRMQVEASVDEADIGRVSEQQEVRFTVDAYPDRSFPARVRQIRKAATETQNVVTYLVILEVDNSDGKLLPGMTANVDIITGRKPNVVRVPTAALRFRPRPADRSDADKTNKDDGKDKSPKPAVYVVTADAYRPARREVTLGVQGEDYVEILSGLKPGDKIIVRSKSLVPKKATGSGDEESDDDTAS